MQKPLLTALLTLTVLQLPTTVTALAADLLPIPAEPKRSIPQTTIVTPHNNTPSLKQHKPISLTTPTNPKPILTVTTKPSSTIVPISTKTTALKLKPIVTQTTPAPNSTLLNTMVTAFPFALTETIPTAIEQATTLAYSTEENFAYAMPSATETSTVASVPSVQKPLLASANFEAGIPVGYASPVKKAKKVKQTNGTRGFWSRLFHRKKVTVAIPSNTSTSYSLPSPWRIAEEPAPTAQEQLLMNFIRKTNPKWDEFNSHALAYWLITVGQQFEVDPRVLASLIAVESSFRYDAVSTSNAKGFGQLKDDTANWLGVTDAFDPLQNLQGTAKYLQYLGQKFPEDASKAIGSYYVGQGTVERQGMTDAAWYYVSKVQRYLDELLQQSASIQ